MAAVGSKYLNVIDVMSLAGVTAKDIINMTAQMNPMLEDAPAIPCNRGTFHETTIKTGLPTVTWGRLYKGIAESKGARQTVQHTPGYLEGATQVDCKIIDKVEMNTAFSKYSGQERKDKVAMGKARLMESESSDMNEAFAISASQATLYENQERNPDGITGFYAFFDKLSGSQNSSQVINAEGKTSDYDCTSLLMVNWHESTNHFIYPDAPGCAGGFKAGNTYKTFALDKNNLRYNVYRREYRWDLGLAVRDWRYVTIVKGIKTSTLSKDPSDGGTGINLIDYMDEAYWRNYGRRRMKGKTFWYGNTTAIQYLDYHSRNTPKNLWLGFNQTGVNAKEVLTFRQTAFKESDAFLNNETGLA